MYFLLQDSYFLLRWWLLWLSHWQVGPTCQRVGPLNFGPNLGLGRDLILGRILDLGRDLILGRILGLGLDLKSDLIQILISGLNFKINLSELWTEFWHKFGVKISQILFSIQWYGVWEFWSSNSNYFEFWTNLSPIWI